jgi:anoctamin-10
MALVPRFLALYQAAAVKTTAWENHQHQSTHEASLTIKTFSLSAIVAYLNLALSAFVYIPFGPDVMATVHRALFKHTDHPFTQGVHAAAEGYAQAANATQLGGKVADKGLWQADAVQARGKLNPSRLQDQMYAYTVTNQVRHRRSNAFHGSIR